MTTPGPPPPAHVLATLVRHHYVLEDVAGAIADRLEAVDVPRPDDPTLLAALLTERLQSVNHDRHLRVRHRPGGAVAGFDSEAHERRYAAEARAHSGGIRLVERLDAHTGVLGIAPYLAPVHLAEPFVRAAFALLADVDHLILDLREGGGGTPETVALVCSHLLGRVPVHLQDLVSRGTAAQQFWTSPAAGRLRDDCRIHVLTSRRTFSACEELAYDLQTLGRATVVGETTGGGAHPVESFVVTDLLEAHIPVARSVSPVTGTNWEQVGVVPDLACPADAAMAAALAHDAPVPPAPRNA